MITKVLTISKLKQLWLELLINKTDKVSDISDNSVLNATAFATAKVAQKCIKDVAIVESQIMPESAVGLDLDNSGRLFGAMNREGALGSSTYLRVIADEGTFYDKTSVTFSNYNGIQFIPDEDLTMGALGYDYLLVRSVDTGSKTNVDPNSIVVMNNAPVGHIACTNEYMALGGRDYDSDELFRTKIMQHNNIKAQQTIAYYTSIFRQINSNILKVMYKGVDSDGKKTFSITTQNGSLLQPSELEDIIDQTKKYFSINDMNVYGDVLGVKLVNSTWHEINGATGIDFRVEVWSSYDPNAVRKQIQINLTKYLDWRYWEIGGKVEWDELFRIVKSTEGVKYCPDEYFYPRVDEVVQVSKLPRVKGFIMRDLSGNIISDSAGILSPVFYPYEE
jgi:hypothetical protein